MTQSYNPSLDFVQHYQPGGDYAPGLYRLILARAFNTNELSLPYAHDTHYQPDQLIDNQWHDDNFCASIRLKNEQPSTRTFPPRVRGCMCEGIGGKVDVPVESPLVISDKNKCKDKTVSYGIAVSRGIAGISAPIEHRTVIQVGYQDVKITSKLSGGRAQSGGGTRAKIRHFSEKSRVACERHLRNLPDGSIGYFLTLTYPFREVGYRITGEQVKYHVQKVRQYLQLHGCDAGFWFLEFQSSGNPHYHFFLRNKPTGGEDALAHYWCNMIALDAQKNSDAGKVIGDNAIYAPVYAKMMAVHTGRAKNSRHCLEPMRSPHAASYYATKYVTKAAQKAPPKWFGNCGRFWASWGDMRPTWQYIYGNGAYAANSLLCVLQQWALDRGFSPIVGVPAFFSRWMRGGAELLDAYLSDVGYVPF